MDIINAPFTDRQVKKLNKHQANKEMHPFTCCGNEDCNRMEREDGGILIAQTEGWICPCGKYKQEWCYSSML